ncbi:hypothetical protein PCASD_07615 [Puccinia coronata f. sp. avenae]|uniref:Uncharacterized protein n=1 Tax=Puccinia coronata f. sp. avenae TaxID=200324 RepID=A0A2N5UN32_9BASI|nr:hypothetical protein PCASD_12866 [Puccinia coronata f. sp. avenae]PLW39175.1 hypothetical protein PCASD_07615 [Puccinia coronata f. sp. avenae]
MPLNNYPPNNSPSHNNHHNGSQGSHAHSSRNQVYSNNTNNFIDPSLLNKLAPDEAILPPAALPLAKPSLLHKGGYD